jgi:alpha-D-ribose 1-methylphosphonate 5-triphosphate synthase subunit PhnH
MSTTWTQRAIEKPGVLEWMAWRRYLTATRASSSAEYPVIEEAAWERLREDLARVGSPLRPDRSFVSETAAAPAPADSRG